jgi:hypothetical protein
MRRCGSGSGAHADGFGSEMLEGVWSIFRRHVAGARVSGWLGRVQPDASVMEMTKGAPIRRKTSSENDGIDRQLSRKGLSIIGLRFGAP